VRPLNLKQFLIDLKSFKVLFVVFFLLTYVSFSQSNSSYFIKVLGTVQDGGIPHLGCKKKCCVNPPKDMYVSSIALINKNTKESYLFDATPDISKQLKYLNGEINTKLKGIFLTHAHIGHYSGLMYLGREALNSKNVPVYAMPRMKIFLETNAPWNQLLSLNNISVRQMSSNSKFSLAENIIIEPFEVPHRDEFSETVGYKIYGPKKTALFIPDIDKWHKWDKSIINEIKNVDYALIDATFFDSKEINYRDIKEIPHPFVIESMELFDSMNDRDKNKILFIHLNHTNPLLDENSMEYKTVIHKGYRIAKTGMELIL